MIGNDVIDLDLAKRESDIFRRNYLTKVLTDTETSFFKNNGSSETIFWMLWSMKESVYKIINRKTRERSFNPSKFECVIDLETGIGIVYHLSKKFYTKSVVSPEKIETIGCEEHEHLNQVISLNKLNIIKKQNIPFVSVDGKLKIASVSHHGRFYRAVCLSDA